jgi:hypothetical protein
MGITIAVVTTAMATIINNVRSNVLLHLKNNKDFFPTNHW